MERSVNRSRSRRRNRSRSRNRNRRKKNGSGQGWRRRKGRSKRIRGDRWKNYGRKAAKRDRSSSSGDREEFATARAIIQEAVPRGTRRHPERSSL